VSPSWIEIDGSEGEGGGQILRSALALALVTGRPFRLHKVRAGRPKPGLLRQHLAALEAAQAVGAADVTGDAIGSTEITFAPHALEGGTHSFAVGGAGSATLVLQTVLVPLLHARTPSRIRIDGGTHNPWAPPYDFLERSFLPLLARMGARVASTLERRGYYPAGGGRIHVEVEPCATWLPLALPQRGAVLTRRTRILLANLSPRIAAAEEGVLRRLLPGELWPVEHVREDDGRGPGNVVLLEVSCEHVHAVVSAFGDRAVRSDTVVQTAVDELRAWHAADVPVDTHLADQLLLPLALGAGGTFRTLLPSLHTRTNARVIERFLPDVAISFEDTGSTSTIRVTAR
jgi:RNA 3'-terminal phosphate cyclase (ATP)